jgi:predicted AAA+ superfamily ATPase
LAGRPAMPIERIGSIPEAGSADSGGAAGKVFDLLLHGFYPRIHDKHLDSHEWLGNYCQTYLERDVREIVEVGNLEIFSRFLRLCAGRSGQLLNMASLAADAGISHSTARRWLSILEASFIVYLLQPHHANFNKRLVKSPKLYFFDTGLLCFLLKIRSAEELLIHSARGAVFETWAISEMLKNFYHRGKEPEIYFWRDSQGQEIDLLVECGPSTIPVEIKSGETVADDFFRMLDFWRCLPGHDQTPAALVYGGDNSYLRKNVAVYSWRDWG